jgi:hypothetical protein
MNQPKPTYYMNSAGQKFVDLGACFDNEADAADDAAKILTLSASGRRLNADGTLHFGIGSPCVVARSMPEN